MATKSLANKLFWSSRPVSWVNTAYPFGLSYLLITGKLDATFWIGSLFFLIPYNLLMYGINDVFDYESDLKNPRKDSIEGAILEPRFHRPILLWAFLLPVPFVTYLYAVGNAASAVWLTVILFTVIAYSAPKLRFKERPVLDSLTSASHFVGPMLVGVTMAGGSLTEQTPLMIALGFTLWGMASHAFGAVQDIRADREGGIGSIATKFGAAWTVRFAFVAYALAGVLLLFAQWPASLGAIVAVPYLVVLAPYLNLTDANCELANRGWRRFIYLNWFAGFLVTLLAIVSVLPGN